MTREKCPECESTRVNPVKEKYNWIRYRCNKCNCLYERFILGQEKVIIDNGNRNMSQLPEIMVQAEIPLNEEEIE